MSPHNEDGVDLTLIDWMLSLTPAERLDAMQNAIDELLDIQEHRARTADSRDPAHSRQA